LPGGKSIERSHSPGVDGSDLPAAIRRGEIKAMYIEGNSGPHSSVIDGDLLDALSSLEFLVVADAYPSALSAKAHVVLPLALSLETDGTMTNMDRTVQRVRASAPAAGEAKTASMFLPVIAREMGYELGVDNPASAMAEIGATIPDYAGVTYARLERQGLTVPVASFADAGTAILVPGPDGLASLSPSMVTMAAD